MKKLGICMIPGFCYMQRAGRDHFSAKPDCYPVLFVIKDKQKTQHM